MRTSIVQMSQEEKKTINHIGLQLEIGDIQSKRVVVLAPRRSGKTTCVAAHMESLMAQKPWLHLEYQALTSHLTDAFHTKYPHLFRKRAECTGGSVAHFLDEGLLFDYATVQKILDRHSDDCVFIYATCTGASDFDLRLEELKDRGFAVISAPLCRCDKSQ